jgi:hypothetical protein
MLSRRSALLLPIAFAACGRHEQREFVPLHYNYLLPIRLNVAAIQIVQRFMPAGVPPDVSQFDPMPPVQALHNMAEDRLAALGAAGRAEFVIQNASLVRQGDTITGIFEVQLDIYPNTNVRAAYATASVTGSYTGDLDDLPGRLYDVTKSLMDRMNVEFEYQVRRSLGAWLLTGAAVQTPVQQQPLTVSPAPSVGPPTAIMPAPSVAPPPLSP